MAANGISFKLLSDNILYGDCYSVAQWMTRCCFEYVKKKGKTKKQKKQPKKKKQDQLQIKQSFFLN